MSAFLSVWAEVRSGGDGKWSMEQIDNNAPQEDTQRPCISAAYTFKNADGSVSAAARASAAEG